MNGVFSPVAGILGSLQANEVLKTILDLKDDLNLDCDVFVADSEDYEAIQNFVKQTK
mgnify:CR=1 FL=1